MNEFDNLFNDFFNYKGKVDPINEGLKKLLDSLQNFHDVSSEEEFDKRVQSELGEPDEIKEYTQDGLHFKNLIWNTPHGQFVEVFISKMSEHAEPVIREKVAVKSLQELLDDAVAIEDYKTACILRDKINATLPKKRGRPKKSS